MATRTVTLRITGTSKELQAALAEAGLSADEASTSIGDHLSGAGEKAGGAFSKLGNAVQNFTGIPVGNAADSMSQKFSKADTSGQNLNKTISTIGGVTLAAGAVGLVAIGAESVKMADAFDVSQAQVQNAVKNSGESFKAAKPSIDATYASLSNLGFNSTEAATALSPLIIATGNTKKAEGDLAIAADLARAKHISLSDASGILVKTLAGSTRGLTSLGLNLDIGSGKLKTIATDTTAYHSAQDALNQVNQKVTDGTLTGTAAFYALTAAHDHLATTSAKLKLDQGTISEILDTVKQKTQGAASAFGDTLAGKEDIAGAKAHDLGTSFGEVLIPKIVDAENAVIGIVGWFEKHKTASEVLAGVIGTVLVGAIGVFTVNMVSGMIGSVTSALTSLGILSGDAEAAGTAISTAGGEAGAAGGELDTLGASASGAGGQLALFGDKAGTAGSEAEIAGGKFGTAGGEAEIAGGKMETAGVAAGDAGMAGGMEAAGGAAGGLAGPLAGAAIGIATVVGGAMALSKALNNEAAPAFVTNSQVASQMSETTLPQLTLKIAAVQKAAGEAAGATGVYSDALGGTKKISEVYGAELDKLKGQQTELTSNVSILSATFGISKGQVQSLASELGINLSQSLTRPEINAMSQQLQNMNTQAITAGKGVLGMSTNASAALTALASTLHSTGNAADWGQLGQDIDFGIGNGITSSSRVVINAAQGMVQSVISASKTGLKASSPSQVFVGLGKNVAEGMALGVTGNTHLTTAAVTAMTSGMASAAAGPLTTITPGNGGGLTTTSSGGAGAGGGMPDFVVNVNGMELLRVLGPDVRSWLLRNKRGTGSLGLS